MKQFLLFLLFSLGIESLFASLFSKENLPLIKMNYSLSPVYLSRLSDQEAVIYEQLNQTWIKSFNSSDTLLSRYLSDYESCLEIQNTWKTWEHPWLSFRMFWRFTTLLPPLSKGWSQSDDKSVLSLYKTVTDSKDVVYPPIDDEVQQPLPNIVVAISNMQDTLDLSASQMAKGIFGPISTGIGLTPELMMEYANLTYRLNFDTLAKDWMDMIETEYGQHVDLEALAKMKTTLVANHDLEFENKTTRGDLYIFKEPMSSGNFETLKHHEMKQWLEKGGVSGVQRERRLKHLALCSNSPFLKENRWIKKAHLKCWNDHKKDAYFTIAPLKTELISSTPDIYLYHDFLTESVMSNLETLARQQIIEAGLGNYGFAWLENTLPFFGNTMRKLESTLGLNVAGNASDDLRITIYPLGSMEGNVHHDAYKAPNLAASEIFADRLGTILIYMSNVALGGETAFPDLDLVVTPVKGTLLYWENYYSDGRVDWTTFHSPCVPVLGNKIMLTAFIGRTDNMFKRPCIARNKF